MRSKRIWVVLCKDGAIHPSEDGDPAIYQGLAFNDYHLADMWCEGDKLNDRACGPHKAKEVF